MTREEDIQAVCKAVLDNWLQDGNYYDYCMFCGEFQNRTWNHKSTMRFPNGEVHAMDCPVLIARDLTAGVKNGSQ